MVQKAKALCESAEAKWLILSAQYGLLAPTVKVSPYEKALTQMRVAQRRTWANKVIRQMRTRLPRSEHIVLLAGKQYREFLLPYLESRAEVSMPLRGLRIGEQLRRLGELKKSVEKDNRVFEL